MRESESKEGESCQSRFIWSPANTGGLAELFMAIERVAVSDALRDARACEEEVAIYECFNSSVKAEKIDLIWEKA